LQPYTFTVTDSGEAKPGLEDEMNVCEPSEGEQAAIPTDADVVIRKADEDDVPALITLHRVAMRELGSSTYTVDQIDSFLLHVPTLDRALLDDHTYFVAEAAGRVVGSGGWSARTPGYSATLDWKLLAERGSGVALIRAMYTHPDWARRGIGRRILQAAEAEACAAGFRRFELQALLPGVPLYRACGYQVVGHCPALLEDGATLPVVHMRKEVFAPAQRRAA
jgi:GNAT superfamily N-acetyltransferase